MASLKIAALLLIASASKISCSVLHHTAIAAPALVPAPPLLRYANVAPQNVLPFSAQVSTFSRHLHVFDAPYAAGVLPGSPAIVQRAVVPGVPHAHLAPAVIPAPHAHFLPAAPAVVPAPHAHFLSAPAAPHFHSVLPRVAPSFVSSPHLHASPAYHAHAYAGPHLHAAVARTAHNHFFPATAIAEGPLLG